ncbi:hypothetical protein Leryth_014696 [Lithospermum erythrorhizon]|nr:hypothetical protein Leryth_014696 [Lithospermum erythrorhizon]
MALTANSIASAPTLSFVRSESKCQHRLRIGSCPSELNFGIQFHPFTRIRLKAHAINVKGASVICSAALSATCAAEQTQTVTRESSTITVAPIQGKEKSPELDDAVWDRTSPRDDLWRRRAAVGVAAETGPEVLPSLGFSLFLAS